ncbi:TRAP transporter large permease [Paracraurococcus ruber]|uniref:TRAP transporter large permease protein n=1 Tax=Paracraurococcus ruber TaxID=77675 RepID=A0ABS1CYR4_9PROT|nr:TRAP transporter large permease [Paracraurococcus ruber]MBK1659669.1 ABC transporter permease [Paracraurococcus ruber]TDG29036.1 TRAP transporter large permease [Paracraurococcus ruber]
MTAAILLLGFFGLLALGVPVAISLAGASILFALVDGSIPLLAIVHRMVGGVDSFPLLCVPFFIFAGMLMNSSGITERIYDFAVAAVGWMRGGLAQVNVVGSVVFAGMSGTAVGDAAGLGTIEVRAMKSHGYDAKFAVGITAASSMLGPLLPPSLPLVIYGVSANASIGQLFAAGIIPGLLVAACLMGMVYYYSRVRGYGADAKFRLYELGRTLARGALPLLTPVIIIGGMRAGAFTPTEGAICAVAYALLLGVLVYRTLGLRAIIKVSFETVEVTATILLIVAGSEIFGWLLTTTKVSEQVVGWVLAITSEKWLILLIANVFLLLVGLAIEPLPAILILTPIMLPIMETIGVDPVHFGLIMVLNLCIGLLTPPVGIVLFILARVAGISFEDAARGVLPFMVPLVGVLLLCTYVPGLVMWLPTMWYR